MKGVKCPYCGLESNPKGEGERLALCQGCDQQFKVCCHNGLEWGEVDQPARMVRVDLPGPLKPRLIGKITTEGQE